MADQPSDPGGPTRPASGPGPTTSPPRWWRVFLVIAIIVVVLFAILLLTGGHGPGRHTSAGVSVDQTPTSGPV